jgi:hypothetical protein
MAEENMKKEEENCHVLTTALLTRGAWEKVWSPFLSIGEKMIYEVR